MFFFSSKQAKTPLSGNPKFQQFSGGLNYADRNLKAIHKFAVVHYMRGVDAGETWPEQGDYEGHLGQQWPRLSMDEGNRKKLK